MSSPTPIRLDPSSIAAPALERMTAFHASTLAEVREAVGRHEVVVVGMAQNPHVKRARKALERAGVRFEYLEFGSYLSSWGPRLAIKLWSGWPTFPQVFVKGTLIGGADQAEAALSSGALDAYKVTGS